MHGVLRSSKGGYLYDDKGVVLEGVFLPIIDVKQRGGVGNGTARQEFCEGNVVGK